MPEIRTHLDIELHKKLKGEAVNRGMHLKQLIARILDEHSRERVTTISAPNLPRHKK